LPSRVASPAAGSPAQQAFRQALHDTEALREQLRQLQASQVATRQRYWQQVGPLATAAVAARRALYAPLEMALTAGYLSRAETQQVTDLLVHNARSLQERFGEDEAAILARYAPPLPPDDEPTAPATPPLPSPEMPAHEQAQAAARAKRQQRQRQARTTKTQAAAQENQALLTNTKAAYRQLARLHHPDRAAQADTQAQQAQTALMQRITAAYAAGDLAALLALLAEHDAPTQPSAEAEALLARYTEALGQQHAQLMRQLAAARQPDESAPWSGTEKQQKTRLREIKRSLRAETEYLSPLAHQLQEPGNLRQLLRALATNGLAGF
jgi:hypothetical protein